MKAICLSSQGEKSDKNEDAFLVISKKGLFVVADGVGGGPSGDYASRTLVDEIYDVCSNVEKLTEQLIVSAIKSANHKILEVAQSTEKVGMATTLACAFVDGSTLTTLHVGDSRIYRVGSKCLDQLTEDHTKVVEKANGVKKVVVTNAVGVRSDVKVEIQHLDWSQSDSLILCSDGVTDVLSDGVIFTLLTNENLSISDKLKALLFACEESGGRDDKTIIYTLSS